MPVLAAAPVRTEVAPVIVRNVRWETYEQLLEDLGPDSGVRTAYSDGVLQLMPKGTTHERIIYVLAAAAAAFSLEVNVDVVGCGSMTCKREDIRKGVEPDSCFYIRRVNAALGHRLDVGSDPPPDLIIEVDVTSGSLEKMPIYAAFGVAEVWRWKGEELRIYWLAAGSYEERRVSPQLAPLSAEFLSALARDGEDLTHRRIVERVAEFARQSRGARQS